MIHFFIGTKAQLIKMAPVMLELRARAIPFRYVDSGQHAQLTAEIRKVFGVAEPDVVLGGGRNISSVRQAAGWYLRNVMRGLRDRRLLREELFPGGGICLVHGDTLSTLLGLQLARRAGLKVGHVEAGLRSYRMLEPFPEEIIRVRCMRRADVLYAPSDESAENLRRMRVSGRVVRVSGNTVIDALRIARRAPGGMGVPDGPFALASCHRMENIRSRARLGQVVRLVNEAAERMPVVFVMHEPTERSLERFGLIDTLGPRVTRRPLAGYADFVRLLTAAALVMSDGGSIQEECAALGKPCLILRKATERPDGLGRNARLWRFDAAEADAFFAEQAGASAGPVDLDGLPRPSAEIVDDLVSAGFGQ